MHLTTRIGLLGLTIALGFGAFPAARLTAQDAPRTGPLVDRSGPATPSWSGERWAGDVWRAALNGESARFEDMLGSLPSGLGGDLDRMRALIEARAAHRLESVEKRTAAREAAMTKLRENLEKGDLLKSLQATVEIQELSDDLNTVLTTSEVASLVEQAVEQVDVAEKNEDWLWAQNLLFGLRTLYEDTRDIESYKAFDARLENANRRVALLAYYAPRRLHELRGAMAERMGDPAIGEFNPALTEDWNTRVAGLNAGMVREGLTEAADRHIEHSSWRPLLEGGIASVRLLATTAALGETFPNLKDARRVSGWTAGLDAQLHRLNTAADKELTKRWMSTLLNDLADLNERTLGLDTRVILREFGDGAMYRLDPYSEIIWPDRLRRFRQQVDGHFVGVGILIRHDSAREILVVNPIEGSPAHRGGIKPNDRIVQVDDETTLGWSLNDAVDRITGKKGTIVRLGVKREGQDEILQIPLTRDQIRIRSVSGWWKKRLDGKGKPEWDWYIDAESRIAYVRLTQFSEDTTSDLREAWNEISRNGANPPRGLILDLRFNPGGLLTSAVQISNMFVPKGRIVSIEDAGEQQRYEAKQNDAMIAASGVPVVVLVNKGSASASEIVAGCLQAHNAAVVVGEQTFGKGSVQTVHHIAVNALLKLTTQYYRLPAAPGQTEGRLVHKRPGVSDWGVVPDLRVTMTPDQVEQSLVLRQNADVIPENEDGVQTPDDPSRPAINDLLAKGLDPQLQTALIMLQAQSVGRNFKDRQQAHLN